jgi:hypothetical protein
MSCGLFQLHRHAARAALTVTALAAVVILIPTAAAHAQSATLRVDSKSSLAWWQMNPHMGHLWATTCPQDPGWVAGSGSTYKASDVEAGRKPPSVAYYIEKKIPLYPRGPVADICSGTAVHGQVQAENLATLKGVRGIISVRAAELTVGIDLRNKFAATVLETDRYPEMRFRIDSLTNVQTGDTIRANAVGTLFIHGVDKPMTVPVKAWREAGGLRVLSTFQVDAHELVETFKLSKWKLGLGIGTNLWKYLHMGVDVVLREELPGGSPSQQ